MDPMSDKQGGGSGVEFPQIVPDVLASNNSKNTSGGIGINDERSQVDNSIAAADVVHVPDTTSSPVSPIPTTSKLTNNTYADGNTIPHEHIIIERNGNNNNSINAPTHHYHHHHQQRASFSSSPSTSYTTTTTMDNDDNAVVVVKDDPASPPMVIPPKRRQAPPPRQQLPKLAANLSSLNTKAFGVKPSASRVTKKPLSQSSEETRELYASPNNPSNIKYYAPRSRKGLILLWIGNVMYSILFGSWLALAYLLASIVLFCSIVGKDHAKLCLQLARYHLWPFNCVIERMLPHSGSADSSLSSKELFAFAWDDFDFDDRDGQSFNNGDDNDDDEKDQEENEGEGEDEDAKMLRRANKHRDFVGKLASSSSSYSPHRGSMRKCSGMFFTCVIAPMLALVHLLCGMLCWFSIFFIPTAKTQIAIIKLLFQRPLSLRVAHHQDLLSDMDDLGRSNNNNNNKQRKSFTIVLGSHRAMSLYSYRYMVWGMNAVLLNCLLFAPIAFILRYGLRKELQTHAAVYVSTFIFCLCAIIPLAYFIGLAVARISAQTSFAVGAMLNATFGTMIELIIFLIGLRKGLADVIQQAVTGSIIGSMLLMPGIAMIFGGFKYKEQSFNQQAARGSSVMLIISMIGVFTPSIFYQIYGNYELSCKRCDDIAHDGTGISCGGCDYIEKDYIDDPVYTKNTRPLMYICATILPIAYCIGLIFSHKTHAYLYQHNNEDGQQDSSPTTADDNNNDNNSNARVMTSISSTGVVTFTTPAAGGKPPHHEEEEAVWSRTKCIVVLVVSTVVYSLVANVLTDALEPAVEALKIPPTFAGLTVLAVIPNTAEYVNAVRFALNNNIDLAMEIGSVSAIQQCLVQMPILVLVSALFSHAAESTFTLIFPRLNLFIILFSVIIPNYIATGRTTNYFLGVSLIVVYCVVISSFFYAPDVSA